MPGSGRPRLKHFISFHNVGANVCLDGGYGDAYGFPGACNGGNNRQIWNIHTNQTSTL